MADVGLYNCICVCLWIVVQVKERHTMELISDLISSWTGYWPSCRLTVTNQTIFYH